MSRHTNIVRVEVVPLAAEIVSRGVWSISYLHLFAPLVFVGDEVDRGGLVGLSGESGPVTGPHLHLAVFLDGRSIDPAVFFPDREWYTCTRPKPPKA